MSYFAEIDKNGNVLRVIVADQDFINSGIVGDSTKWIETKVDGSIGKNFAAPGYVYDNFQTSFIPPKPFASFILDPQSAEWMAPKAEPIDGKQYLWNESLQDWVILY